jgi:transcriptional regulator with XRE-family HTH domain
VWHTLQPSLTFASRPPGGQPVGPTKAVGVSLCIIEKATNLLRLDIIANISQSKRFYPNVCADKNTITPQQSRGARAMLGWSRDQLAVRSGVSPATLADFEAGKRVPYNRTLADIRRALEDGGVKFIPENGGGPGARLKNPASEYTGESKRTIGPPTPARSKLHQRRSGGRGKR